MTTPKEALEKCAAALQLLTNEQTVVKFTGKWSGYGSVSVAIILDQANDSLASLEGDAVERVALPPIPDDDADFTPDLARKIIAKYQAILASGLVPDEAAVRADWHTTGWDRARNSGRILLVWREFAGVREHVELGRYSDSKIAWVNTYGHPFHAEPDGWAPLLPFKTTEAIRADERERCARQIDDQATLILNSLHCGDNAGTISAAGRKADTLRYIADAIRAGRGE